MIFYLWFKKRPEATMIIMTTRTRTVTVTVTKTVMRKVTRRSEKTGR